MSVGNVQATAAANALRGEKAFKVLQYPETGDYGTDFIAGIMALVQAGPDHGAGENLILETQIRGLEYMLNRLEDTKRYFERERNKYKELTSLPGQGFGQIGQIPSPLSGQVGSHTTAGGTSVPGSLLANVHPGSRTAEEVFESLKNSVNIKPYATPAHRST